jgi:hypothetical protein
MTYTTPNAANCVGFSYVTFQPVGVAPSAVWFGNDCVTNTPVLPPFVAPPPVARSLAWHEAEADVKALAERVTILPLRTTTFVAPAAPGAPGSPLSPLAPGVP